MGAHRSKAIEWRRSLEQIRHREGVVEIAIAHGAAGQGLAFDSDINPSVADLLWRLRIVEVGADEFAVERPSSHGRPIDIPRGTALIGAVTIEKDRWMFRSRVLGIWAPSTGFTGTNRGIRIAMPHHVERCLRRATRVTVTGMRLPKIEMWPLLDPSSALPCERAYETALQRAKDGFPPIPPADEILPKVGAGFQATLVNIGSGGLGVLVEPEDAVALSYHRLFWVRFGLGAVMPIPIAVSARIVHTHIDAAHRVFAGVSFNFDLNPAYQASVGEQIIQVIGKISSSAAHDPEHDHPVRAA